MFQVDERRIQIRNARLSDSGSYVCIVENEAGEARKRFELAVLGKITLQLDGFQKKKFILFTVQIKLIN